MSSQIALAASLVVATLMGSGAVVAANDAGKPTPSAQRQAATGKQAALEKDARNLSADGSRAFEDVALTRLAIFDGRTDEAKKDIADAVTLFEKAKSDDSVFTKAEANMTFAKNNAGKATNTANGNPNGDTLKPLAWLPVDGEIFLDEDFSGNAKKAAAAAEANKNLAKGDRAGAVDELKLADVNVQYVVAAVPVDQTLKDVHAAAKMIDDGKYFEANQALRRVQASAVLDVLNVDATPKATNPKPAASATTAPKTTH